MKQGSWDKALSVGELKCASVIDEERTEKCGKRTEELSKKLIEKKEIENTKREATELVLNKADIGV